MLSTLIVLGLLTGLLAASVMAWALLLWLGGRWARIPEAGFKSALLAALLAGAIGLLLEGVVLALGGEDRYPLIYVVLALGSVFLIWKVVQRVFHANLRRAVLAWLPTLLLVPAAYLLASFVIHPYVLEAFSMPTNGMAPTIMGDHLLATCPRCGGQLVISAEALNRPDREDLGICVQCLQTSDVGLPDGEPLRGDRVFVLKSFAPRRWDIIAFRFPEEPSTIYLKRLVGLPGEELAIRDGEVWIDGQIVKKPRQLADLRYTALPDDPFGRQPTTWGPVRLGEDEYFVLGDFSRRSADSRYWKVGAPGHQPFAVPESYLEGVATHIYWPPSRWRIFR
jgi:signal peptidase I